MGVPNGSVAHALPGDNRPAPGGGCRDSSTRAGRGGSADEAGRESHWHGAGVRCKDVVTGPDRGGRWGRRHDRATPEKHADVSHAAGPGAADGTPVLRRGRPGVDRGGGGRAGHRTRLAISALVHPMEWHRSGPGEPRPALFPRDRGRRLVDDPVRDVPDDRPARPPPPTAPTPDPPDRPPARRGRVLRGGRGRGVPAG